MVDVVKLKSKFWQLNQFLEVSWGDVSLHFVFLESLNFMKMWMVRSKSWGFRWNSRRPSDMSTYPDARCLRRPGHFQCAWGQICSLGSPSVPWLPLVTQAISQLSLSLQVGAPPVFFVVKGAKRLDPEEVINLKKGGLLRVFSLNKWLVGLFSPGAFHQKTKPNRKDKSRWFNSWPKVIPWLEVT